MLAQLKPTQWVEYVNTQFKVVDVPSGTFYLTLANVVEQAKTERSETFSLFFRGPLNLPMAQGIHQIEHDQLGALEIFLVPIAQDKDGFQYEAAFNHLIQSA